jgi:hypothetical protein
MTPGSSSLNGSAAQSSSLTTAMPIAAAEFVQLITRNDDGIGDSLLSAKLMLKFVLSDF